MKALQLSRRQLYSFILFAAVGCAGGTDPNPVSPASHSQDESKPALRVRTVVGGEGKLIPEVMVDAPNLYPLPEGVAEIEDVLKIGKWLVIVYGQDSIQDVHFANQSPRISKLLEGTCRVAIRPTRRFQTFEDDVKKWLPELTFLQESTARPLFILLEDGKLTGVDGGWMSEDDLRTFVHYGTRQSLD